MAFQNKIAISALLVIVALHGMVHAQKQVCSIDCQVQYVRQFITILEKSSLSMEDYFKLFSEPEGPEGVLLFNTEKKQLIIGEDKDHIQEMTLAGDAFEEVIRRDKKSRSEYLTCLHRKYINNLPEKSGKLETSVPRDKSEQIIITLVSINATWKFRFSVGEAKADSVVAPDGVVLGFLADDPCLREKGGRRSEVPPV
jgi:hypothetical protein